MSGPDAFDHEAFDYEAATWGAETVRPGERTIAGFRLDEALLHLPERGRKLGPGHVQRAQEAACAAAHLEQAPARGKLQQRLVQTEAGDRALPRPDAVGAPERRVVVEVSGPAHRPRPGVARGRRISTDPSCTSLS